MFIAIEGIDGAGKSTQARLLVRWLDQQGRSAVLCRDPGSTDLGEEVRKLLLASRHQIGAKAQMLLYMAARAQMVDELIAPTLYKRKAIVVCDRYVLSNVVYQGYGCGLDPEVIWQVGQVATGGVMPQLTIVLDLEVHTAQQRLQGPRDRIETLGQDFFQRLVEGYRQEAQRHSHNIVLVPADRSVEEIHQEICQLVQSRLLHPRKEDS